MAQVPLFEVRNAFYVKNWKTVGRAYYHATKITQQPLIKDYIESSLCKMGYFTQEALDKLGPVCVLEAIQKDMRVFDLKMGANRTKGFMEDSGTVPESNYTYGNLFLDWVRGCDLIFRKEDSNYYTISNQYTKYISLVRIYPLKGDKGLVIRAYMGSTLDTPVVRIACRGSLVAFSSSSISSKSLEQHYKDLSEAGCFNYPHYTRFLGI